MKSNCTIFKIIINLLLIKYDNEKIIKLLMYLYLIFFIIKKKENINKFIVN